MCFWHQTWWDGITDFTSLSEKLKKYKSFKTYDKYNDMIHVISNWGDNAILKVASFDDPEAAAIRKFRKNNIRGYNYTRDFEIEKTETFDGSQRLILKHKKSGGIVSHAQHLWRYPRSSLQTRPYEGREDTSNMFTNVVQSHYGIVHFVLYGLLRLSWEAFKCATNKRSKEAHLVIRVPRLYTGRSHRYEGNEEAGNSWKYSVLDHDCQRSFDWAGVSLCAPTEEGHFFCCPCSVGKRVPASHLSSH